MRIGDNRWDPRNAVDGSSTHQLTHETTHIMTGARLGPQVRTAAGARCMRAADKLHTSEIRALRSERRSGAGCWYPCPRWARTSTSRSFLSGRALPVLHREDILRRISPTSTSMSNHKKLRHRAARRPDG